MKHRKPLTFFLILVFIIAAMQFSIAQNTTEEDKDEDKDKTDQSDTEKTKDEDKSDDKKDDDGDGVDDEKEDAYEREVEVEVEDYQIKIQSKLKNGENKDKIEFEFKVDEEPEFKLKYSQESNTSEVEVKFKVKFYEIIEYLENGNETGFQKGEEVSRYRLDKAGYEPITHTQEGTDPDITHIFTAVSSDGVFKLIMKLTGSIQKDADTVLTPNSLKIDVEINDFPYQGTGSSLAIVSRLKTESDTEKKEDTEDEAQGFTSDESEINFGTDGFFSWADNATADGVTVDVVSSSVQKLDNDEEDENDLEEGERTEKLTFSFIAKDAKNIYWDPRVGVVSAGTQALLSELNGNSLPGFGLIYTLIAVFTLSSVFIRKRRK